MSENNIGYESPAPRTVTKEGIEAKIASTTFHQLPGTLTICVLTLQNGFTVTGQSACVDPANFNLQIGQDIARANAFEKIWELEGYLLKEEMFQEKYPKASAGGMKNENAEDLGLLIDSVESYAGALNLVLPPEIHIDQLKEALPDFAKRLKAIYVSETGENHWED